MFCASANRCFFDASAKILHTAPRINSRLWYKIRIERHVNICSFEPWVFKKRGDSLEGILQIKINIDGGGGGEIDVHMVSACIHMDWGMRYKSMYDRGDENDIKVKMRYKVNKYKDREMRHKGTYGRGGGGGEIICR